MLPLWADWLYVKAGRERDKAAALVVIGAPRGGLGRSSREHARIIDPALAQLLIRAADPLIEYLDPNLPDGGQGQPPIPHAGARPDQADPLHAQSGLGFSAVSLRGAPVATATCAPPEG